MRATDLQPLCRTRHRDWSLLPIRGPGEVPALLPVGLTEATALATVVPLVFQPLAKGGWQLCALMKAAGALTSPLQLEDGRFLGRRPLALRLAPFALAPDAPRDARLWIDLADPRLSPRAGGTALFTPDGHPAAPVSAALRALSHWGSDCLRARAAAGALHSAGLLQPLDDPAAPGGLFAADPDALEQPPGLPADALRLAWISRVSQSHLRMLALRADHRSGESNRVGEFLAAMTGGTPFPESAPDAAL